jgi:hypothetical protein
MHYVPILLDYQLSQRVPFWALALQIPCNPAIIPARGSNQVAADALEQSTTVRGQSGHQLDSGGNRARYTVSCKYTYLLLSFLVSHNINLMEHQVTNVPLLYIRVIEGSVGSAFIPAAIRQGPQGCPTVLNEQGFLP